MKACPKCNQTYDDANLNFCLNDGEMLTETQSVDAPPTIMMDAPRQTNDNWGQANPGFSEQPTQNQQIFQQPYSGAPQGMNSNASLDQTLAIVAIITGALSIVLSWCCYMGIFIGPVALITGYMGMSNANKNPDQYGGKGLAIAGMVAGGVGMGISVLMFVLVVLLNIINP